jgi:hypothetical protein
VYKTTENVSQICERSESATERLEDEEYSVGNDSRSAGVREAEGDLQEELEYQCHSLDGIGQGVHRTSSECQDEGYISMRSYRCDVAGYLDCTYTKTVEYDCTLPVEVEHTNTVRDPNCSAPDLTLDE